MIIKKWKQIGLASLAVVLTTNTQASIRDGVYFGAGVGGAFDSFNLRTTNTVTGFSIHSPTLDNSTVLGDVFLGYGGTMANGFYLAGELGTYFPRRSATLTGRPGVDIAGLTFTDILRVQDYVTLDALPGYRFNESWLLYGRAGVTFANLSLYQPAIGAVPPFNFNENKIGGRIGLGVNYAFNLNFGLGLDYFYTAYQDMNATAYAFNTNYKQSVSSNFVGISAFYTI